MKVKIKMKFLYIFLFLHVISITFSTADSQTLEPLTSRSSTTVLNENEKNIEFTTSSLGEMFWVLRNSSPQSSTQKEEEEEEEDETESMGNIENISVNFTEVSQIEKQDVLSDPVRQEQNKMDEQIFLNRNNCDVELQINEWEDKKLKIEYGNLEVNKSGQCHTMVYGKGGLHLALLVTDIHFSGKSLNGSGEILRIISRNNNFNFTLIEYRGNEHYYPVILTDSDRAFIILYYNATRSTKTRSGFNLEVFNYYKNPIRTTQHKKPYTYSDKDINTIFLTTNAP